MNALILISAIVGVAVAQVPYSGLGAYGGLQGAGHHQPQQYAPPAPVGRDGTVIDTPEVAQAKAAHFAEYAKAAARAAEKPQAVFGNEGGRAAYPSYPAPPAPAHYAQPSYVAPSNIYNAINPRPEIAYPRHYDSPLAHNFAQAAPIPKNYASPIPAKPHFAPAPLAEDGTVIDTPEVAALKAVRLQELADAEARAYKYAGPEEYPGANEEYKASDVPVSAYQGHLGNPGLVGRGFSSPNHYPTQNFAASAPYSNKYQSPPVFQPHSYQSQHVIGTY